MKHLCAATAIAMTITGCAAFEPYGAEESAAIVSNAIPISFGETVVGASISYPTEPIHYRFSAQPGQPVTITLRSKGPDAGLSVGSSPGDMAATDFPATMDPNRFNANGPHAEVRTQLPQSPDGNYYIWLMFNDTGAYSLTLQQGLVVSQDILTLPEPLAGTTGKYMSPFTTDDTITPWVEKGLTANVGANVGQALGSVAAFTAGSDSPYLALAGGILGEMGGRALAIEAVGGWDFIKANSDQSFESIEDMSRFLHYRHSGHPQYKDVLAATYGVYPELKAAIDSVESGY